MLKVYTTHCTGSIYQVDDCGSNTLLWLCCTLAWPYL